MCPRALGSRREFLRLAGMGTAGAAALASLSIEMEAQTAGSRLVSLSGSEPSTWVRINSNENPYGPSERALAAIRDSLTLANRYARNGDEFHSALCGHHQVPPKMVEIGYGSSEILKMAAEAFLGPGKSLVVAHPTYEALFRCAKVYGSDVIRVPLNSAYQHDLKKMSEAANEKTGLVYICNPNNPTATVVSGDQIKEFVQSLPKATTVLIDEAYHHYVEDPSYSTSIPLAKEGLPIVITRTFSKVHGMAGLRVGYAVGREDLLGRMTPYKLWLNQNVISSAAALASVGDEEHVRRIRKLNSEVRDFLVAQVKAMGLDYIPSHANFMMIDVKHEVKSVLEALQSRQILAGRPFPPLNSHLRVTIGTHEEMEQFVTALQKVVS